MIAINLSRTHSLVTNLNNIVLTGYLKIGPVVDQIWKKSRKKVIKTFVFTLY